MFKFLIGQRNRLAAFTAVVLVIQGLLPVLSLSVPKAHAASTLAWEFNPTDTNYTLDSGLGVYYYLTDPSNSSNDEYALQFKINDFSASGLGADLSGSALNGVMRSVYDDRFWGIDAAGKLVFSSDAGAKWEYATGLDGAAFTDIINANTNLIAVGRIGGALATYYSADGGGNWTAGLVSEIDMKPAVAVDAYGTTAFMATTDGHVLKTTDSGVSWNDANGIRNDVLAPVVSPKDVVCLGSANAIAVSGLNASNGAAIDVTTDGGTSWGGSHFPDSPSNVASLGYDNGWLYAADANWMASINIGGGKLPINSTDWVDLTNRINGGTYAAGAKFFKAASTNLLFISIKIGSTYYLYSSANNGWNWFEHYNTNGSSSVPSGGWAWNSSGSKLFWSGTDGANAVIQSSTVSSASTSAVLSIGQSAAVYSITADYNALSDGGLKASFSSDGTTFYYYDTSDSTWKSSTEDSSSKATSLGDLTGDELWAGLRSISSSVDRVKLYTENTFDAVIVNSVTITYDAVSGGNGGGNTPDLTPPSTQVDTLPEFSTVDDPCDPLLHVTASGSDVGGGTIQQVALYVSTDGTNFSTLEDAPPDLIPPYEWDVSVKQSKTYYFYSIGTDTNNNVESPPVGQLWDTKTTMDWVAPWMTEAIPYPRQGMDNTNYVGVDQAIELHFSEIIDTTPANFVVSLFPTDHPEQPINNLSVSWNGDSTIATITHPEMAYNTEYTFRVLNAQDRAGNLLHVWKFCRINKGWVTPAHVNETFPFKTQPKLDPDLLNSTLTVAAGSNPDGSYNAGDNAQFTLTLSNKSATNANNVATKISIPAGMSYVSTDNNGDGTVTLVRQNGVVTQWEWRNNTPIKFGQPAIIKFTLKINDPAIVFEIKTTARIYDNVYFTEQPDNPLLRETTLKIAHNAQLVGQKIVDKTDAQPGDVLTYQLAVNNFGTTVSDIEISDYVPLQSNQSAEPKLFFVDGSITYDHNLTWSTVPYYDEATQQVRGVLKDVMPNGVPLGTCLTFKATIRVTADNMDLTNTAEIWDPSIIPAQKILLTATTKIPGLSKPDTTPLVISYQNPAPNSQNVHLKQSIKVGFNKSIKLDDGQHPFIYDFFEDDRLVSASELASWNPTWSAFNGHDNAMLTLTPPTGELAVGATYEMSIASATDTYGLSLEDQPITWDFTTADPIIKITTPASTLYEMTVNKLSDRFTVTLFDDISGQRYTAEDDIRISLKSYLGSKARGSGSFWENESKALGTDPKITIAKGADTAYFYYRDSVASTPNYITIRVFENPNRGWLDDEKYVQIAESAQPTKTLVANFPETLTAGKISPAITISAQDEWDQSTTLPTGRLYFYSATETGIFYGSNRELLPYLVTVQNNASGMPQYLDLGGQLNVAVYFSDLQVGNNVVTISDNYPQWPDIGFNDVSTVIAIQKALEEEKLKELEEVKDDSGRMLKEIKLTPTNAQLLPAKTQLFKAVAYDTDGKLIENAKFGWFALVDKAGTIKRNGDDTTTAQSTFTASANLGNYSDAVMVASLYNGKIAYATADITITDVVTHKGPKGLPVTGMNGLQLILMGLTLSAAVALAWVEHYDKTHFKKGRKSA